jgi:hypothetical protein
MTFFINVGYQFKLDPAIHPDGAIIPCIAMPSHELERRKLPTSQPAPGRRPRKPKNPHLLKRLIDPQLYMAGLEAAKSPDFCVKLASYPWFGVQGLIPYDSATHKQTEWRKTAAREIRKRWRGAAPTDSAEIAACARECVDFQIRNGAWGIIVPSPLTYDPSSDYSLELEWLDAGLARAEQIGTDLPVFASVALSDVAFQFHVDPAKNPLLDLILDHVSARGVAGVYIVVEQSRERDETRQCGSPKTLRSLLYLVHRFAHESKLAVGVNFIGAFGLACQAAGASWWASNWYKSLYRVRLADKLAGGRVFPLFWSARSVLDVNLESDFDTLAQAGLGKITDVTPASHGLIEAAKRGLPSKNVPAWAYTQSNCAASIEHFLYSAIQMDAAHSAVGGGAIRVDFVNDWLKEASDVAAWALSKLGTSSKTRLEHSSAWLEAFEAYRNDHSV